jgi:hypothetical protein
MTPEQIFGQLLGLWESFNLPPPVKPTAKYEQPPTNCSPNLNFISGTNHAAVLFLKLKSIYKTVFNKQIKNRNPSVCFYKIAKSISETKYQHLVNWILIFVKN